MAAEVQPLPAVLVAPGPSATTPDQTYWRSFKSQLLIPSPQSSPITSISTPINFQIQSSTFSIPELFTLTSGSRISVLSTRTRKTIRTISRTSSTNASSRNSPISTVHSAHLRRDARIILSSSSTGLLQLHDANSRSILRTWDEHAPQPVWSTAWNPVRLTNCLSSGDDRSVRTWDLSEEKSIGTWWGHTDYVRACDYVSPDVIVSGGYDGMVKIWDGRSPGTDSVMTFSVGEPVEKVLPFSHTSGQQQQMDGTTATNVIVAAGEKICVLDLVAGRAREVLVNHQRTVTSLALASGGTRLVSGGLDGHVKIFDTTEWKVVAGFKYPSPVLSVAVIPVGNDLEDRHLAVGMQSGLLSIRTRLAGQQKVLARAKEKEMKALIEGKIDEHDRKVKKLRQGDKKRLRGRDFTGEGADIVIEGNVRGKIRNQSKWETALRKGHWAVSLDMLLHSPVEKQQKLSISNNNTLDKRAMLTLLTALHHRSALRTALSGRDEETLVPLLRWITKNINDPRHVKLLSAVALQIIDIYAPQLGGDDRGEHSIDSLIASLHRRVKHAVEMATVAGATGGMLDFLNIGAC